MFLLGISENKETRKEFVIYWSNVVVPNCAGFFPPKTFCFAKMTSRVFNIVLEGSFQRSCYEPGSTMLKTRDVIEAKLKVWGDKKACAFGTTLLRKQNSPRHIIFRNSMQNIIFLPLEKVFKIKPACVKSWFQKSWKKSFFPEILEKKYSGYAAILENKKRGEEELHKLEWAPRNEKWAHWNKNRSKGKKQVNV